MKLEELISEHERAAHRKGMYRGAKVAAFPAFLLGVALMTAVHVWMSTRSDLKALKVKDAISMDLVKCYKDILRYEDVLRLERDIVESWKKNHKGEGVEGAEEGDSNP